MQLELQCQKCDESFDVDPGDLASDPELRCPGCGAKATLDQAEALSGALEELFAAVAALRRKFTITGELDSAAAAAPATRAAASVWWGRRTECRTVD